MILTNKTYKDLNFNQMFQDIGMAGGPTASEYRVPNYQSTIDGDYDGTWIGSTGRLTTSVFDNTMLIVSGKYLDMLEKINIKLRDPAVVAIMNAPIYFDKEPLLIAILSNDQGRAHAVLNWMVSKNILTAEDILPKSDIISLSALTTDYSSSYDAVSSVWTVKIRDTLAVTLSKRYAQNFYDNNLFLFKTLRFNGNNYIDKDGVLQFGYVAWSMTDRDGDGDIKIDHLDKVDYIDGISFKLKIPNYF